MLPDAARPDAAPSPPLLQAPAQVDTYTGETAILAAATFDADGDPLSVMWSITSRPEGSVAALTDPASPVARFAPDVDGRYTVDIAVSDGRFTKRATLVLRAHHPIRALPRHVVDAEHSDALEAIVYVSTAPHELHVHDTATDAERVVALPFAPIAVSVAPDGLTAAVGHAAAVTIVRLDDPGIIATHAITTDASDVVLAGNGFVYAFARGNGPVTIIDVASGAQTISRNASGDGARLQPGGNAIYTTQSLERIDISAGTELSSWTRGDVAGSVCGDLWITEDGARIVTACGRSFFTGSTRPTDAVYAGGLERMDAVGFVDHSRVTGKLVAIGPTFDDPPPDVAFQLFDDAFLSHERTVPATRFHTAAAWLPARSRFAFLSADGNAVTIIVEAPTHEGLVSDDAVARYPL